MGLETCVASCTFIVMAMVLAVPIAMVCVGALNKDKCTMEPNVPIFLIVYGAVGIVSTFVSMCWECGMQQKKDGLKKFSGIVLLLLVLFTFAWAIVGSVWVFKKWSDWDAYKKAGACHEDTYLFAFAMLIIFWITLPCYLGGMLKKHRTSSD